MTEIPSGGPSALERILWRLVLVLLVIGAVLMAWSMLGHRLTPTQLKFLMSSFGVAIYASMGLACAACLQRQPTSLGARAGLFIAFAGAAVLLVGVWTRTFEHAWWWKAFGCTFVTGFATALGSLLLLVHLDDRFLPVRALTRASLYAWAGLLVGMMLFEANTPLLWRLVGLSSTMWTFGSLAIPVLSKLSAKAD